MYRFGIVALLVLVVHLFPAYADSTEVSSPKWRPSPGGAALRSLAFPGWGQAYNGRPLKSVIVGAVEEGLIFGIVREHQLFRDARQYNDESAASVYKDQRNRFVWILAGWLIYSSVDAYVDAHLYDFDVSDQLSINIFPVNGITLNLGWTLR